MDQIIELIRRWPGVIFLVMAIAIILIGGIGIATARGWNPDK